LPAKGFNWRDLKVFVRHVDPHSHLYRAMFPEAAGWDLTNQLIATVVDIMRWFQWVKGGAEGSPPDPIKRPGARKAGAHRRGHAKMSVMNEKLGFRPIGEVMKTDPAAIERLSNLFRGQPGRRFADVQRERAVTN
jgi:hypothetical protein